jgi:predicted nucleic acid-binding protein
MTGSTGLCWQACPSCCAWSLAGGRWHRRSAELPRLRKRGVTVRKSVDVLIATWCIENDVELLHADRDFDVMEPLGLKVVRG